MILSFRIMPKQFVIHQENRHFLSVLFLVGFWWIRVSFVAFRFATFRFFPFHSICLCMRLCFPSTHCSFAQNVFLCVCLCAFWVSKSVCLCPFLSFFRSFSCSVFVLFVMMRARPARTSSSLFNISMQRQRCHTVNAPEQRTKQCFPLDCHFPLIYSVLLLCLSWFVCSTHLLSFSLSPISANEGGISFLELEVRKK